MFCSHFNICLVGWRGGKWTFAMKRCVQRAISLSFSYSLSAAIKLKTMVASLVVDCTRCTVLLLSCPSVKHITLLGARSRGAGDLVPSLRCYKFLSWYIPVPARSTMVLVLNASSPDWLSKWFGGQIRCQWPRSPSLQTV
jgi:hypothetical protein